MSDELDQRSTFERAHDAIAQAQELSSVIGGVLNECRDLCPSKPEDSEENFLQNFAQRLTELREAHKSTSQKLLRLRLEQLSLRQQQLSALHGLLGISLGDGNRPLPSTTAAINSAKSLITESLASLQSTVTLATTASSRATEITELIDKADRRADNVANLARRLLDLVQGLDSLNNVKGATSTQLQKVRREMCSEATARKLADEGTCCSICLAGFSHGEELGVMPCHHIYHFTCLSEWLSRSAACPFCKKSIEDDLLSS